MTSSSASSSPSPTTNNSPPHSIIPTTTQQNTQQQHQAPSRYPDSLSDITSASTRARAMISSSSPSSGKLNPSSGNVMGNWNLNAVPYMPTKIMQPGKGNMGSNGKRGEMASPRDNRQDNESLDTSSSRQSTNQTHRNRGISEEYDGDNAGESHGTPENATAPKPHRRKRRRRRGRRSKSKDPSLGEDGTHGGATNEDPICNDNSATNSGKNASFTNSQDVAIASDIPGQEEPSHDPSDNSSGKKSRRRRRRRRGRRSKSKDPSQESAAHEDASKNSAHTLPNGIKDSTSQNPREQLQDSAIASELPNHPASLSSDTQNPTSTEGKSTQPSTTGKKRKRKKGKTQPTPDTQIAQEYPGDSVTKDNTVVNTTQTTSSTPIESAKQNKAKNPFLTSSPKIAWGSASESIAVVKTNPPKPAPKKSPPNPDKKSVSRNSKKDQKTSQTIDDPSSDFPQLSKEKQKRKKVSSYVDVVSHSKNPSHSTPNTNAPPSVTRHHPLSVHHPNNQHKVSQYQRHSSPAKKYSPHTLRETTQRTNLLAFVDKNTKQKKKKSSSLLPQQSRHIESVRSKINKPHQGEHLLTPGEKSTHQLQLSVRRLLQRYLSQQTPKRQLVRVDVKPEKGKKYRYETLISGKEAARKKKPSKLKKIILEEREEKRKEDKTTRRRVREYVTTKLTSTTDTNVKNLVIRLSFFQNRLRENMPLKYKQHRRVVAGLKESLKMCKMRKAQALIVAPDIEKITGKGGLDALVGELINTAHEIDIPIIFALNRRKLGQAMGYTIKVSTVCIISHAGAYEEYGKMLKELEYFDEEDPPSKPAAGTEGQDTDNSSNTLTGHEVDETAEDSIEESAAEYDHDTSSTTDEEEGEASSSSIEDTKSR